MKTNQPTPTKENNATKQQTSGGRCASTCSAFRYSPEVGRAEFDDFIACKVEEARHTENQNAPVFHLLEFLRDAGFDFHY